MSFHSQSFSVCVGIICYFCYFPIYLRLFQQNKANDKKRFAFLSLAGAHKSTKLILFVQFKRYVIPGEIDKRHQLTFHY